MMSSKKPPKPLNWGILGTARINRSIIPAIKLSNRNQLVALASRKYIKAETHAKEWNIANVYGSYDALLSNPAIDVVYIPLPNSLHSEWVIKAAQAGKHILCEKPIALSIEEVDMMVESARKSNVVLAEAFMYRHHLQTLRVKELVDDGLIGEVLFIRGSFSFPLSREGDVRFKPELGGGALWDIGCYPVNFTRYIMGREPHRVFGWQLLGATGVDLSFAGHLEFSGNALAQFDCSFTMPFRTSMEIVGRRGRIELTSPFKPSLNEKITVFRDDEAITIPIYGHELYSGEIEDMADAILLGKTTLIPIEDSRANVAVIQALYKSANICEPVEILV
ncbi:MAG: Gfo/Idh/MocA family oxidoreductase [Anaerolineales bacterium]|nr:Gfo/Idh/MocA family oxidoreductase [Anaerolineales bacterium]